MIAQSECVGCTDNFYNSEMGRNGRCWNAETGVMMTRYQIHINQVPDAPGAYTKVRKPSCYRQSGRNVFHNSLPSFVKASDLNRAKRV